jgi:hypothetical protein
MAGFHFRRLQKHVAMLQRELSDDFFAEVADLTEELKNLDNLLISARLGSNLQSVGYTLRRKERGFWLKWKLNPPSR